MTLAVGREKTSPNRRHERRFFYKYTTARVAKTILTTRKLRWSSPILFNDPFDVTQELRFAFDEAELSAALNERWMSLFEEGASPSSVKHPLVAYLLEASMRASPAARQAMARERRNTAPTFNPAQTQWLTEIKGIWKEIVPTMRILCLSELNDVTPMWQHYADGYKGVVLEYSPPDAIDSVFLAARPVIYQDAPPAIADPNKWVSWVLGLDGATYWAFH